MQRSPMIVLPEMPVQAAMTVCAPMRTLWPIWIRLSSLTPSSITVSSIAPRSMVVLAPISTSSPMRTAPTCGTLTQVPPVGRKAEAVAADHAARLQHAARADRNAAAERDARRKAHVGAELDAVLEHAVRPDAGACTDADALRRWCSKGPTWALGSMRALAATSALGCTPGSRRRRRMQQRPRCARRSRTDCRRSARRPGHSAAASRLEHHGRGPRGARAARR